NGALDRFHAQQGRVADEVIDGDPFGSSLVDLIRSRVEWEGTATELLTTLLPEGTDRPPRGWPKPTGLKGRVKRLAPALEKQGITVSWDRDSATRERRRLIYLRYAEPSRATASGLGDSESRTPAVFQLDGSDDSDGRTFTASTQASSKTGQSS